ncbi:MAG: glutaredoxin [Erysipelotrichaceae bacterium]
MQPLTYFYLQSCPYCIKAKTYIEELMLEERYKNIEINRIDEAKDVQLASQYDYYLVPTFYLGQTKLFEGIMNKEDVRKVFEIALGNK